MQVTTRLVAKSGPKNKGMVKVEWQVPVVVRRNLLELAGWQERHFEKSF